MAARAANRNRIKQTATPAATAAKARVATRTNVVRSAAPQTTTQQTPAKPGVAARSAVKQKAVNMGTKVTAATENVVIPENCQNAFYGCMDSFCMLANTSGGRCRCDDRSKDLDAVLEQIQKLDAQSKTLAEEGVERLQRGDAVDAIYAMAEDAANKVTASQKKNQRDLLDAVDNPKKSGKLDLSMFNANIFDTDEIFGDGDDLFDTSMTDKTGGALRSSATKLCTPKIPTECREFSSMLQLVYAQKIKSDCMAYENDLKQQRMNSENLLKTAQKAVRDAAAEAYENANKYDLGQCILRFKQCMTGDEVCGSNFSKCVVNPMLVSSSANKPKQVKTGTTVVEISSMTYDLLNNNKSMCENVLNQCVLVRDKVWNEFLRNVAPELKSAEYVAEDERRRSCVPNVISCIKEQAEQEGYEEGSDSWYLFTSDTTNVEKLCKIQLQQCASDDPQIRASVIEFVKLGLGALRADRCSTAVKNCLKSDTVCHSDYSNCLGVTPEFLWNNCGEIVKPDCTGATAADENGNVTEVSLKKYISQVAAGVLQNLNNDVAARCNQAVNKIMTSKCGGTSTCYSDTMIISESKLSELFDYEISYGSDKVEDVSQLSYKSNPEQYTVKLTKKNDNTTYTCDTTQKTCTFDGTNKELLQNAYNTIITAVETDPEVQRCKTGAYALGFDNELVSAQKDPDNTQDGFGQLTFEHLTDNTIQIVAKGVYDSYLKQKSTAYEKLVDKRAEDTATIMSLYAKNVTDKKTACNELAKGLTDGNSESKRKTSVTAEVLQQKSSCGTDWGSDDCCKVTYDYEECEESDDGKCKKWKSAECNTTSHVTRCYHIYEI